MNYGYACINETLKSQGIFTNRSLKKATLDKKGLEYVSDLALQNTKDLKTLLEWNLQNNIVFFRMSSNIIPWGNKINMTDLKDYNEIASIFKQCGDFAKTHSMRITSHPGQFNLLSSPKQSVVDNTIADLKMHSDIFDLMELNNTPYNKINIHIGAAYNDKLNTSKTWVKNFKTLPESISSRLTVENDDKLAMYSVKDLYDMIYQEVGIPIVFDYHHHRFCDGGLTEEQALKLAVSTWGNIKPVVHYSESKALHENIKVKPQAHSDYINGPINTYGCDVDIMLETKKKELSIFKYQQND